MCLSALCVSGCGAPPVPPDILLITLDTTRADRIGAYGYSRASTPRLDRLAREGVLFERALAAAPITLPAHASLMTGSYPFVHGVRDNGAFSLSDATPTLAATLQHQGYRTAAFVGAFVLDRRFGLARGFDSYDDRLAIERRGDRTAAAAGAWLDARAGDAAPFFLWLHLYDPHDPYDPPPPFRDSFAERPYDGEIAFADAAIGTIVDKLEAAGRRSSTIVAVAGDHGESLGEHGEDTHAVFVYDSTMQVPMIVAWPGHLPPGRRVPAMVRAIDLAPTLLDLAGQPALAGAQGRTLVPLVERGAAAPGSAYGESYFPLVYLNWAPLRSLRDDRWKFIDAPVPELYDLSRDPGEAINLAPREPSRVDAMRRALDGLTGGQAGAMAHRRVDSETAARLAALGYVGSAAGGSTPEAAARRDPKEMIAVFNRIRQANAALQAGRFAEADAMARQVLTHDRRNGFATIVVADAALALGRYRDAVDAYRAYLELVPGSADAHHRTSIAWARLGDTSRALAEEDAALAIDRRHADALVHRGGLLASLGRMGEARRALQSAVEIAPDNAAYRVGLARILVTAGELDAAEAEAQRALQLQPDNADAHAALGSIWMGRDQPAKAVGAFQRALALRPDADDVRLDLAAALGRSGRAGEAREEYARLAAGSNTPPGIRQAARERLR